jgi:hypothetical protein
LAHNLARITAAQAIRDAPEGHVVRISEPTRSLEQNALLWTLLQDVSQQVQWPVDGELVYLSDWDWKSIFTAALKRHSRIAKGIDGGVVMLGESTSRMSKQMLSDLIELIYAFAAERGVTWSEPIERKE